MIDPFDISYFNKKVSIQSQCLQVQSLLDLIEKNSSRIVVGIFVTILYFYSCIDHFKRFGRVGLLQVVLLTLNKRANLLSSNVIISERLRVSNLFVPMNSSHSQFGMKCELGHLENGDRSMYRAVSYA